MVHRLILHISSALLIYIAELECFRTMSAKVSLEDRGMVSGMVLVGAEVVVRPAQCSSRASHGRQRKEMEARDWDFAVGSLKTP